MEISTKTGRNPICHQSMFMIKLFLHFSGHYNISDNWSRNSWRPRNLFVQKKNETNKTSANKDWRAENEEFYEKS